MLLTCLWAETEDMSRTFNIITFGCQMNEHDSDTISGLLQQKGYTCLGEEFRQDADIIIINTCSIRENADKRFFGTLGQLKKIKERKPDFAVCVCGCMMQQDHIITKVKRSYPWVDVIFGTHNIHELPDMLEEMYAARREKGYNSRSSKKTRVVRTYPDREGIVEGLPAARLYRHKSFVNIMYGCNNFCTYCVVPYTRGREKSRRPEDIIAEVGNLVADGVREITLLGQNVNSYIGITGGEASCSGQVWDFADLIYALAEIDGLERIRFMTSHPKDLSDKLIEAFARCDKLCNYIHLPVQAGNTRVLERMNRKYTREQYLELVRKLRKAVPEITISTDIIVGFPGETDEQFEDTLSLAEEVGYDSAFTFLYSPRRGTPAADYEDQVPEDVKHERFNRLVDVINSSAASCNAAYTGRICHVLIEGFAKKGDRTLSGRTEGFKLVDISLPQGKTPEEYIGEIVSVRITGSNTFSLRGKIIE